MAAVAKALQRLSDGRGSSAGDGGPATAALQSIGDRSICGATSCQSALDRIAAIFHVGGRCVQRSNGPWPVAVTVTVIGLE
jgi:hypothetical protein